MRRVLAALIALGLIIGVIVFWPRSNPEDPPETVVVASTTTTTTAPNSTTTSSPPISTTTTGPADTHVVETVAEAESILRELWFGWFEGIYNEDEERIREVVATERFLGAGVNAFGTLEFTGPPTPGGLSFLELEILRATEDCLAVWSVTRPTFLELGEPRSGVEVLRRTNDGWKFASAWRFREDLWEADCESQLLPLP